MRRWTIMIGALLVLSFSACSVSTEALQKALDATDQALAQTQALLIEADRTLATTKFALDNALDQGFGPEAVARAQNAVFSAESVVNDIKTTLAATRLEQQKWQAAVTEAETSGSSTLDLTKLLELGGTSLLSILAAVKATGLVRDKARVARGEVTGATRVEKPV